MNTNVNEIYRAYNAAENAHDIAATAQLVAADLTVSINGIAQLSSGAQDDEANAALFAAYPDYSREIVEIISAADRGTVRWVMRGTSAPGSNLPDLDVSGCSVVTIRDGRLSSAHLYADMRALEHILPSANSKE
ncbi:MAG: nuclear transport factor 2 family protein [Candidatus Nanopelagicales bacterium]